MKILTYSPEYEKKWEKETEKIRKYSNSVITIGASALGPFYSLYEYFNNRPNFSFALISLLSGSAVMLLMNFFVFSWISIKSKLASYILGFIACLSLSLICCYTTLPHVSFYLLTISTVVLVAGVLYFGRWYDVYLLTFLTFGTALTFLFFTRPEPFLSIPFLSSVVFISVFVAIFSSAGVNYRYMITKENFMKELKLHEAHQLLEEHNKDITESIRYAKNIQLTILPEKAKMDAILKDYFVFYIPKDIVSGDFYWFVHRENKIFIAAVDCTGHGVPGAFMSVLGYNTLNHIVNDQKLTVPSEILQKLDEEIRNNLKQNSEGYNSNDGMDISLCVFDTTTKRLQFSSANRTLVKINKGILEEIKGDKFAIGGRHQSEKKFNTTTLEYKADDIYYLFTDGITDQFGGNEGKKFTRKRLYELLTTVHSKPMVEQEKLIAQNFENWKSKYEQTDDVTLIGIRPIFN